MTAAQEATYRVVGTVTRAHGIKGGLKVRPETDDPSRFSDLDTVYTGQNEATLRAHAVVDVAFQPMKSGTAVLLQLDDIGDRSSAEAFVGDSVWARVEDLPPLAEGEVFLTDLPGLEVRSQDGEILGHVADVFEHPAHITLSVSRSAGGTALVPFVPEIVVEFDVEAGWLAVAPLEGLLEGEPTSERE